MKHEKTVKGAKVNRISQTWTSAH